VSISSSSICAESTGHGFHGLVVAGEKAPARAFPVLGGDGPAFAGGMKIFHSASSPRVGVDELVVDGGQDPGAFLVDVHPKTFKPGLFAISPATSRG